MDCTVTKDIPSLPTRRDDAHKGDVGRIAVVGGCAGELMMVGAPSLCANAAYRAGAGLVQLLVPEPIRGAAAICAPCATVRTLPVDANTLLNALSEFKADVLAIGPGLGDSLTPDCILECMNGFPGAVVADADALNRLSQLGEFSVSRPERILLTPHAGEMERLLNGIGLELELDRSPSTRRDAAITFVDAIGCTVILKGRGTVVASPRRYYINETGNAGMATGGTGDILTGVIAGLVGQKMDPFDAAVLGVYLHGLAGDFTAEELGRHSLTALDLLEYLPEAFAEHATGHSD